MSTHDTLTDQSALIAGARALGIELTSEQAERFQVLQAEILDWNQRINLTSITDPRQFQIKHILDSLTVLAALEEGHRRGSQPASLVDVGSGAGLPGLPLGIVVPTLRVTLLEATQKKCRFLEHIVGALALPNVAVSCGRAEELAHHPNHRGRYDYAVARGVASLAALVEMCLPFVRMGGRVIAPKKLGIKEEIAAAGRAIAKVGGKLQPSVLVRLPIDDEERQLLVVERVRSTPGIYPRRPGVPSKSPL